MRKIKRPKIGERVLLTRWHDKSLYDPWFIGFLCEVGENKRGMFYRAETEEGEESRSFKHCWRISLEESVERIQVANFKESRGI